jgi:NAD(P)-dependent dehydrogenase (short-subunit alcohol dehydrogenase family)
MNIIVTGASQGVGFELVKRFSISPHNKIIAISRNSDRLKGLLQDCKKINPQSDIVIIPFDLSMLNNIRKDLAVQVFSHFESLDILINNAGHLVREPFESLNIQDLNQCVDVNFMAPVLLTQSLMPLLRKSRGAHIVNIGSMAAIQGSKKFPGLSAYSASKAALQILTECLAEEFTEENMHFNSLALGAVQTEMLARAFPGYEAPIKAFEMAELIADFAINGRRYYQGKTIQVSLSTP